MTTPDVRDDVRSLLCETLCFQDTELDDQVLLSDYGLTSIDLLDVVAHLESRYAIKFKPESMARLTAESLVQNVRLLLAPA